MSVLVNDPYVEERLLAERKATEAASHDEVWDGTYVMSPIANNEHQRLAFQFAQAISRSLGACVGDQIFAGTNVSDREEGWLHNYRVPDVAVVLQGNPAKDCGTHWCGGPDFLVEILSPNDLARDKRGFYAAIGVRELLIIDRDPWAIELYRLTDGALDLAGRSTPEQPEMLSSTILPLTFHLVPGPQRPQIQVAWADGGQNWLI